jgi:hypothetical protein
MTDFKFLSLSPATYSQGTSCTKGVTAQILQENPKRDIPATKTNLPRRREERDKEKILPQM